MDALRQQRVSFCQTESGGSLNARKRGHLTLAISANQAKRSLGTASKQWDQHKSFADAWHSPDERQWQLDGNSGGEGNWQGPFLAEIRYPFPSPQVHLGVWIIFKDLQKGCVCGLRNVIRNENYEILDYPTSLQNIKGVSDLFSSCYIKAFDLLSTFYWWKIWPTFNIR